jgi:hypothetical protein
MPTSVAISGAQIAPNTPVATTRTAVPARLVDNFATPSVCSLREVLQSLKSRRLPGFHPDIVEGSHNAICGKAIRIRIKIT